MEDRYRGELVLVFERALLDELGTFNGTRTDVGRYLDVILDKKNNHFHLRVEAEQDESLKQIIPYVLFVHGEEVFSYVRGKQAGEQRLRGNRSVGIGGHIDWRDAMLFEGMKAASDRQSYLQAVRREIDEEVIVDEPYDPVIAALLNDDSNPVGRVHFGLIHICRLQNKSVRKREQQMTKSGFLPVGELAGARREELESWSAHAIDFLLSLSD